MALLLYIESATEVCSVALAEDTRIIQERRSDEERSHTTQLAVFVNEVLSLSGVSARQLDGVCVSRGPGSYTGLRIGVSVAKGLCYGTGCRLLSVSTLQAMVMAVEPSLTESLPVLLAPMIDARRMEVYTATFNSQGHKVSEVEALVLDSESFARELEGHIVCFFGNGSDKAREVITHSNARFISGIVPSAAAMAPIAAQKFTEGKFEDVAYFEPFYLKDFIATVPKRKVLGG